MDTIYIIAHTAAAAGIVLTIVQFWMKTMIPLRVLGVITNVLFLFYSSLAWIWPTFILNLIVLPLNAYRLHEMRELIRRTQQASDSDFDMSALEPFMSKRKVKAGEVLFRKDDLADAMFLVVEGNFQLTETGSRAMVGEPGEPMVGELPCASVFSAPVRPGRNFPAAQNIARRENWCAHALQAGHGAISPASAGTA
jgi:hypothetical protein